MPAAEELIAHDRTTEEVCEQIGADKLIYQDLEDLEESAREGNPAIAHFDCSVFNGKYVTGDIDQHYLDELEQSRNDKAKTQQFVVDPQYDDNVAIDLYNNK